MRLPKRLHVYRTTRSSHSCYPAGTAASTATVSDSAAKCRSVVFFSSCSDALSLSQLNFQTRLPLKKACLCVLACLDRPTRHLRLRQSDRAAREEAQGAESHSWTQTAGQFSEGGRAAARILPIAAAASKPAGALSCVLFDETSRSKPCSKLPGSTRGNFKLVQVFVL